MTRIRLKYVDRFIDRHGRQRHYFRRNHGPRLLLPGLPGSAEFMLAYQEAASVGDAPRPIRQRGEPGTFARLTQDYFASSDFTTLSPATRAAYRNVIERFLRDENISHRLVRQMRRQHVSQIVARRADTPGAANDLLKKLRILIRFAIANGWRSDDPTVGIKKFAAGEFHTWTDAEGVDR